MHEETLSAVFEGADEGFILFNKDRKCALVGRRIGEIFGVERAALHDGPEADVLELLASACEEPEAFVALVKQAHEHEGEIAELELKRPMFRVVRFRVIPVAGGFIGIARDITRERSAERRSSQLLQRLEQITAIDALTQLPNRRRFGEELDREHGRAARAWDSYAVLRIDVDDFSAINTEFGIPAATRCSSRSPTGSARADASTICWRVFRAMSSPCSSPAPMRTARGSSRNAWPRRCRASPSRSARSATCR